MIVLSSITGCASFLREVGDFQQGWRTAEVIEVGRAPEIKARGYTDCRKTASEWQLANSRFAALSYRMNRRRHVHIVLVPKNLNISLGDTVYANVERCGAPLEIRSSRFARQSTLMALRAGESRYR
jgi:hypothetical protein